MKRSVFSVKLYMFKPL